MSVFTNDGHITLRNGNIINNRDLTGIPAQGNDNPFSEFQDHAVLKYFGFVYDPSYGLKHTNENDWEDSSVGYFGTCFFFTRTENNVLVTYSIACLGVTKNLGDQRTTFIPTY